MNKTFYYLSIVCLAAVLLAGCSIDKQNELLPADDKSAMLETIDIDIADIDTDYFVSSSDIDRYVDYKKMADNSRQRSVRSIEPVDYQDVTLFYIVNYDKGWEVVSADKRTQVVLACGSEGAFSLNCDNQNMLAWMNSLALDVLDTRLSSEVKTTRAGISVADPTDLSTGDRPDADADAAQQNPNVNFWNAITAPEKLFPQTRGGIYSPDMELVSVTTTIDTVCVDHLIETKWYQGAPWNKYVPLKSNSSTERCPAGCVAVAGAQMLYYLHYFYGVPETAFLEAYCSGNYHESTMWQYNDSATAWDKMGKTTFLIDPITLQQYDTPAVLIANVGTCLFMNYRNDRSGVVPSKLVDDVFVPYDISCNYADYNATTVISSLNNMMPVILSAYGNTSLLGLIPKDGHTWIVDGYQDVVRTTRYVYRWTGATTEPNLPAPQYVHFDPQLPGQEETFVQYTDTTHDQYFRMNWGWPGNNDDTWFALNGNWEIVDSEGEVYHFTHNRHMITGFAPINQ